MVCLCLLKHSWDTKLTLFYIVDALDSLKFLLTKMFLAAVQLTHSDTHTHTHTETDRHTDTQTDTNTH